MGAHLERLSIIVCVLLPVVLTLAFSFISGKCTHSLVRTRLRMLTCAVHYFDMTRAFLTRVAPHQVRLLVLDSVAFHFRHGFTDMALRSRTLSAMAQQLNVLAQQHHLAVVVTNQV